MRRPQAFLCALALAATVLACAPVLFLGKSFVSPQNYGVPLFYDACPTLPVEAADCSAEHVRGADVGAMMWAFFPLSLVQERSLKQFGEFPLWNRYNSAGITMLGQGQMMLGDPLQWLLWLTGVGALGFDLKFVFLRFVFAAALGISVLALTRTVMPAALVAFAAPFVGHFIFRVNHPAIFTLCYSPLILLAWLKLVYGEERRRAAWLAGLMLANWLVLNSGTAKEAYMAMIVLNAIGAVFGVVERARFGARQREYALLLAAAGASFLLLAAPVWGSLLDSVRHGTSFYARNPEAHQLWPGLMLGFVDNLYYLLSFGTYYPSVNPFLFAGVVLGALCAVRTRDGGLRRASIVLVASCAGLVCLIYGVVPGEWLLQVPVLRNVIHIHNTFSTIMIVPASVLAGIGFAHLAGPDGVADRRRATVLVALVFVTLLVFYLHEAWPTYLLDALLYSSVVLGCAALVPELVFRLARRTLSPAGIVAGIAVLVVVLGRGAAYPGDVLDPMVLNPKARMDLAARPALLERFAPALAGEPARVLGVGYVLFTGYNATLGLENINGPDAIWNPRYRDLTEALQMPFQKLENWRMRFTGEHIGSLAHELDFLGVGVVLSREPLPPGAGAKYLADDTRVTAYSRPHPWPRAFYAGSAETYADLPGFAARVSGGDGKPFVALEHDGARADPALRRLLAAPGAAPAAIVRARDYVLTNNTTAFTIDAPAAGLVYLGETDEPGSFRVTVNGAPAAYVSANYTFKAVAVEGPGTYRIVFRYWPARLSLYLTLAGIGLVLCGVVLLAFYRVTRSGAPRPD